MAEELSAENYRARADEMKSQAQRAETVYLQALYASIADNWDRLAEHMRQAELRQKDEKQIQKLTAIAESAKVNGKGSAPRT